MNDYPDFSDAYISKAEKDGRLLDQDELDSLNDNRDSEMNKEQIKKIVKLTESIVDRRLNESRDTTTAIIFHNDTIYDGYEYDVSDFDGVVIYIEFTTNTSSDTYYSHGPHTISDTDIDIVDSFVAYISHSGQVTKSQLKDNNILYDIINKSFD